MEQSQESERIKKEEIITESMNIREFQKKAIYKINYEAV
jgi:glutamate formiminotransferase